MRRGWLLLLTTAVTLTLAGVVIIKKRERERFFTPKSPIKIDDKKEIKKILIKNQEKEITLVNSEGEWLVQPGEYPADQSKINTLLESIEKINQAEVVSTNKEKHSSFEVNEKAINLTLEYPERKIKLLVGKTSFQRQGTFIREEGKDTVFIIPAYLRSQLENKDWKDYYITQSLPLLEIEKIKIAKGQREVVLKKEKERWKIENKDKQIEKEKVENLVNALEYLRGEEVYSLKEKKIPQKASYQVTILLSGKEIKLSFSEKQDQPLVQKNQKFIYSLEKSKYSEIKKVFEGMLTLS